MSRKSRITKENLKHKPKVWRIAIYIRLSKEDARNFDESESVANQRKIILEHIESMNDGDEYSIAGEYVDDGISGTTDDEREDFQRMLADIERGHINCVIVKDLARSFRNYSDQGYYLDDWFPRNQVRFISLFHQPLDSYREPQNMRNIVVPIQGVLNENHCAETSEKVREVFDMKRRNGKHIGSFAVYGYLKNPGDRNALVIDEEAAAVVRDIFHMFLSGHSKNEIVHYLNDYGVLCPALYKQERLKLKYQNPNIHVAKKPLWCAATVTNILKNRMYCGDMVQGRSRIKSYKVHMQETVPENEWYIVENTHEAIIDREIFEKVQQLLSRDTRIAPQKKQIYLFGGFLRCADCGKAMSRSEVGGRVYYYCRTYKDQSKCACTRHTIRHDRLEAAVLYAIQQQIYLTVDLEQIIEYLHNTPPAKSRLKKVEDTMKKKERELDKILRYKQAIYQDWKDGEISHSDYCFMKEVYKEQEDDMKNTLKKLRAERTELPKCADNETPILEELQQYQNINKLSRDLLIQFVDCIMVHEGGNIRILFQFSDGLRRE